ncbi:Acetyltransferase (GNAT) family protein [Leptolyngbya sp. O-77]|nr:Acetyltransferase (GNAT) family protein [Leptolyngbya sp. O-77]
MHNSGQPALQSRVSGGDRPVLAFPKALQTLRTLHPMSSSDAAFEFKPIDLAKHHQVCVQFRADAFVCSFGSAERFYEPNGAGAVQYLRWLERRIAELPNGCVHLWKTGQIIGQIELGRWKRDASVGYVNLFYLAPEYRGQGLGARLDEYAAEFFGQHGYGRARLSASPTNLVAIAFYQKRGWVDLGQRRDMPDTHYFEKVY